MSLVRPSFDEMWLEVAKVVSKRSNCIRRSVGCVMVEGRKTALGYNGTPSGSINCYEGGCERCNSDEPRGSGYQYCCCIHAEMNALFIAHSEHIDFSKATLYTTVAPCTMCLKEIVQNGINEIVHNGEYVPMEMRESHFNMIKDKNISIYRFEDGRRIRDTSFYCN